MLAPLSFRSWVFAINKLPNSVGLTVVWHISDLLFLSTPKKCKIWEINKLQQLAKYWLSQAIAMAKVAITYHNTSSHSATLSPELEGSMSETSIFEIISDFPNDTSCAYNPYRWFWGVHRYLEGSCLWSGMSRYHFSTNEYWSLETKRSHTSYAGRRTSPTVYSVSFANQDFNPSCWYHITFNNKCCYNSY